MSDNESDNDADGREAYDGDELTSADGDEREHPEERQNFAALQHGFEDDAALQEVMRQSLVSVKYRLLTCFWCSCRAPTLVQVPLELVTLTKNETDKALTQTRTSDGVAGEVMSDCKEYVIDVAAATIHVCKCGAPKKVHSAAALTPTEGRRRATVPAWSSDQDAASDDAPKRVSTMERDLAELRARKASEKSPDQNVASDDAPKRISTVERDLAELRARKAAEKSPDQNVASDDAPKRVSTVERDLAELRARKAAGRAREEMEMMAQAARVERDLAEETARKEEERLKLEVAAKAEQAQEERLKREAELRARKAAEKSPDQNVASDDAPKRVSTVERDLAELRARKAAGRAREEMEMMVQAANEEPTVPKHVGSDSLSNKVSIAANLEKSFDPSYIKPKPSMALDDRRREHQKQKVREMTIELKSTELHTTKQNEYPTAILAASLPEKFEVRDAITTKGVAATVQWTLLDEHFQPCAEPESGPCGLDGVFSFHGRRLQEPANYLIEQIHGGHV